MAQSSGAYFAVYLIVVRFVGDAFNAAWFWC